jgi:hypothetical protein
MELIMDITVSEACRLLEAQGALRRLQKDHSEGIVQQVRELLGGRMPAELEALYRERVESVGDFAAILPKWNERPEWRREGALKALLPVQAVPIFSDGSGSLYGLDLSSGDQRPAVYFFDHEDLFERPHWAAGSSIGHFLLLLAQHDQAIGEGRSAGWELSIDPELDKCPRAPPIWLAG